MKSCSTCKKLKSKDQFPWRNKSKGLIGYCCSTCTNSRSRKWFEDNSEKQISRARNRTSKVRLENNIKLLEFFKTNPCVDCNESNPLVLDFDHQRDKLFCIKEKTDSMSWDKLQEEISKCKVRCANCHRIKTAKEKQTCMYKLLQQGPMVQGLA